MSKKLLVICSNRSFVSADGRNWINFDAVSFWRLFDLQITVDNVAVPLQIRKFPGLFSSIEVIDHLECEKSQAIILSSSLDNIGKIFRQGILFPLSYERHA